VKKKEQGMELSPQHVQQLLCLIFCDEFFNGCANPFGDIEGMIAAIVPQPGQQTGRLASERPNEHWNKPLKKPTPERYNNEVN
jgi:hypothetical protein